MRVMKFDVEDREANLRLQPFVHVRHYIPYGVSLVTKIEEKVCLVKSRLVRCGISDIAMRNTSMGWLRTTF
jgi:hypothetical protein